MGGNHIYHHELPGGWVGKHALLNNQRRQGQTTAALTPCLQGTAPNAPSLRPAPQSRLRAAAERGASGTRGVGGRENGVLPLPARIDRRLPAVAMEIAGPRGAPLTGSEGESVEGAGALSQEFPRKSFTSSTPVCPAAA